MIKIPKEIESVMLIDSEYIDRYISLKVLESHGVPNVLTFDNINKAIDHLQETTNKYQFVLIGLHKPIMDNFEFIEKLKESELLKTQGQICFLSASVYPEDKERFRKRKIKFIEKPLTMEKLLN